MHFLLLFLVIPYCKTSDAVTSTKINYLPNGQVGGYQLIINNTVQPRLNSPLPRDNVSKIVKHTSNFGNTFTRVDERVIGENSYLKVHSVLQQHREQVQQKPQRQERVLPKYQVKNVLMVPSVRYVDGAPENVKLRFAQIGPYAALIVPVNKAISGDSESSGSPEIGNIFNEYIEVQEPPSFDAQSSRNSGVYPPPKLDNPDLGPIGRLTPSVNLHPKKTMNYVYPAATNQGTSSVISGIGNGNGFVIRVGNHGKSVDNDYQEFFVPASPDQLDIERDANVVVNPSDRLGLAGLSKSQQTEVYFKDSSASDSDSSNEDRSTQGPEADSGLKDPVVALLSDKSGTSLERLNIGKYPAPFEADQDDQEIDSRNDNFRSSWSLVETQNPQRGYNHFQAPPPGQPEFSDVSSNFGQNGNTIAKLTSAEAGSTKIFSDQFQDAQRLKTTGSAQDSSNERFDSDFSGETRQTQDGTVPLILDDKSPQSHNAFKGKSQISNERSDSDESEQLGRFQENRKDFGQFRNGGSRVSGQFQETFARSDSSSSARPAQQFGGIISQRNRNNAASGSAEQSNQYQDQFYSQFGQTGAVSNQQLGRLQGSFGQFSNDQPISLGSEQIKLQGTTRQAFSERFAGAEHQQQDSQEKSTFQALDSTQQQPSHDNLYVGHQTPTLTQINSSGALPFINNERFKTFIRDPSLTTQLRFTTPNGQTTAVLTSTGDSAKVELPSGTSVKGSLNGNIVVPNTLIPSPSNGNVIDSDEALLNSVINQRSNFSVEQNTFDDFQDVQNNATSTSGNSGYQQQSIVENLPVYNFSEADNSNVFDADEKLENEFLKVDDEFGHSKSDAGARKPNPLPSSFGGSNAGANEQIQTRFNSGVSQLKEKDQNEGGNVFNTAAINGSDGGQSSTLSQSELSKERMRNEENSFSQFADNSEYTDHSGSLLGKSRINFVLPGSGPNAALVSSGDRVGVNAEISGLTNPLGDIVIPKFQIPLPSNARIPIELQPESVKQLISNGFDERGAAGNLDQYGFAAQRDIQLGTSVQSGEIKAVNDQFSSARTGSAAATLKTSATDNQQLLTNSSINGSSVEHADLSGDILGHQQELLPQLNHGTFTAVQLAEQKLQNGQFSSQLQKNGIFGNLNFRAQDLLGSPVHIALAPGVGPDALLSTHGQSLTSIAPETTGTSQHGEILIPKYVIPEPTKVRIPISLQSESVVLPKIHTSVRFSPVASQPASLVVNSELPHSLDDSSAEPKKHSIAS